MVQVKKEVIYNKTLFVILSSLAYNATNSYQLAKQLEKSPSVVYRHFQTLSIKKFILKTDENRGIYELNYEKISSEFFDFVMHVTNIEDTEKDIPSVRFAKSLIRNSSGLETERKEIKKKCEQLLKNKQRFENNDLLQKIIKYSIIESSNHHDIDSLDSVFGFIYDQILFLEDKEINNLDSDLKELFYLIKQTKFSENILEIIIHDYKEGKL